MDSSIERTVGRIGSVTEEDISDQEMENLQCKTGENPSMLSTEPENSSTKYAEEQTPCALEVLDKIMKHLRMSYMSGFDSAKTYDEILQDIGLRQSGISLFEVIPLNSFDEELRIVVKPDGKLCYKPNPPSGKLPGIFLKDIEDSLPKHEEILKVLGDRIHYVGLTIDNLLDLLRLPGVGDSLTRLKSLYLIGAFYVAIKKRIRSCDSLEKMVERTIEPTLAEVIVHHLKFVLHLNNRNYLDAYTEQSYVVQSFTKLFQTQKEENWAIYVMYVIARDLRLVAVKADKELAQKGAEKSGITLEKAAECLMGLFRVCAADNRTSDEDTKRWGMLYLVNQLLKIYFRINKLHLCKALIRAIEASPFKDQFTLSQQVTYRYYVGRKAIFESDFKSAEKYLTFAFERCHRNCRTNKRLVLIYLIPVKMILGHLPAPGLLQKYDLLQFLDVVTAVREGNLLRLNQALSTHESFFISCGVYLILEKLKVITYRNLFKKVTLLMRTHQIPIDVYLESLKFMQIEDVDMDETQCILANLIYENKIKGYISNSHNKLVVSKQNAFPSLSTIA
uniref:PCI domain-containing protein 2 homolog n=1 Tax=Moina brachiata TaxID=675436 RepID=A0A4Y7NK98_9CRUS|nr:EOG090X06A5 [Moina brachiata]